MRNAKLLFLILFYVLVSCEDISVSKKDLLAKSWILEETTLNGENYDQETIYLKNSVYTFFNDKTLQIVISQNQDIINGTWQLIENDSKLTLAFYGVMHEYKIQKIDNSNLWLSINNSDGIYLYKYTKILLE